MTLMKTWMWFDQVEREFWGCICGKDLSDHWLLLVSFISAKNALNDQSFSVDEDVGVQAHPVAYIL